MLSLRSTVELSYLLFLWSLASHNSESFTAAPFSDNNNIRIRQTTKGGGISYNITETRTDEDCCWTFFLVLSVQNFDEILIKFVRLPLLVELEIYAKNFSWQKAKNFVLLLHVLRRVDFFYISLWKVNLSSYMRHLRCSSLRSDNDLRFILILLIYRLKAWEKEEKKSHKLLCFSIHVTTIIYFTDCWKSGRKANGNKASFKKLVNR